MQLIIVRIVESEGAGGNRERMAERKKENPGTGPGLVARSGSAATRNHDCSIVKKNTYIASN